MRGPRGARGDPRREGARPFAEFDAVPAAGVDTDNGTEFVDDALLQYCQEAKIEFTRGRPYRKNDQAWVEQKNG